MPVIARVRPGALLQILARTERAPRAGQDHDADLLVARRVLEGGEQGEERGQGEAIARNLLEMAALPVPIIALVTGEGGSGGALALGVADRVLMLEFSVYSVISPEGCSAILWNDGSKASEAAELLKMTSHDLKKMDLADEIIMEPLGGAHHDYEAVAKATGRRPKSRSTGCWLRSTSSRTRRPW